MSFNSDEYELDEVFSTERRPPDDRDTIWIRNAVIEEIVEERDVFYVTVRYEDKGRGPGRGPDRGPGRGPGIGLGVGPVIGISPGPGVGPGMGPGIGPVIIGPGQDRGPGPERGPDRGPDRGQGREPYRERTQRIRLVVGRDTRIINQNGREVPGRRLRVGMRIDALISSITTRSIPPQSTAFLILIEERLEQNMVTTGRIIQVDVNNRFIVTLTQGDSVNVIRFNVTPETVILGFDGRRIQLQDLFIGIRVRVEHASFMTASIPPQTTAFVIQAVR